MATKHTHACCCTRLGKFNMTRLVPCEHPGTVERDGKWYCRRHDPVAIKTRQDARYQRYVGKIKRATDERIRALDCFKACVGMQDPVETVAALKAAAQEMLKYIEYQTALSGLTVGCNAADAQQSLAYVRANVATVSAGQGITSMVTCDLAKARKALAACA